MRIEWKRQQEKDREQALVYQKREHEEAQREREHTAKKLAGQCKMQ